MKKTMEILLPESWADITLKTYLELITELKNYEGDEEASGAILLWKLCGIDGETLQGLSRDTFQKLRESLMSFLNRTEGPLQRIVDVNGNQYGFEPNLSQMSYGAYADITRWDTLTIDSNWPQIMDILYRPVTKQKGELYETEVYVGKPSGVDWMSVGMDVHFGALFFFVNLSMDLVKNTQNYLMEMAGMEACSHTTSHESGEPMEQLLNSQVEMLRKLIPSLGNL